MGRSDFQFTQAHMSQSDPSLANHKIDAASLAALPRSSGVYVFRGEGTILLMMSSGVRLCLLH